MKCKVRGCHNYAVKGLDGFCSAHSEKVCKMKVGNGLCRKPVHKDGLCEEHFKEKNAPPVIQQKIPHDLEMREAFHTQTPVYWPEGKDKPETFQKRPEYPCPRCNAVKIRIGYELHAATVKYSQTDKMAYFRCRNCDKKFSLPIA